MLFFKNCLGLWQHFDPSLIESCTKTRTYIRINLSGGDHHYVTRETMIFILFMLHKDSIFYFA